MQAIVFNGHGVRYTLGHVPQARVDEIPVRVLKAGICETDLQLIQGYMGFTGVLGHEFVGIAESGRHAGRRVCGEINCSCGECRYCLQGLSTHCPKRTVLGILGRDGAFAERIWLPEENLHPLPDEITDDQAVFVEPLAAAFQIPAQLDLSRFHDIYVLGDGRLGNLCAQVLQSLGRPVRVVGKHPLKLDRLRQRGIATLMLHELGTERVADLVVDCTGSPSGLASAFGILRPRGTLVLKSTTAGAHAPNLAPVVIDEFNIVGSRCGPFARAIDALARRKVDVDSLITSRFPLAAGHEALTAAGHKNQLKVILDVV